MLKFNRNTEERKTIATRLGELTGMQPFYTRAPRYAYNAGGFCNGTIQSDDFPDFEPGKNHISWTGGISYLEITPRWWTL